MKGRNRKAENERQLWTGKDGQDAGIGNVLANIEARPYGKPIFYAITTTIFPIITTPKEPQKQDIAANPLSWH